MRPRVTAAVFAAGLATAGAAHATSVTLTDTIEQDGDLLTYAFTGLPTSISGDATVTIATTGTGFDGIDLGPGIELGDTGIGEYMEVTYDGLFFGRWECGIANDFPGPPTPGGLIPGATGNPTDCLFSLTYTFSPGLWGVLMGDGALDVTLFMGPNVTDFSILGEKDEIAVTLTYDDATVIPLPASVPLLLSGLGLLAILRRRAT